MQMRAITDVAIVHELSPWLSSKPPGNTGCWSPSLTSSRGWVGTACREAMINTEEIHFWSSGQKESSLHHVLRRHCLTCVDADTLRLHSCAEVREMSCCAPFKMYCLVHMHLSKLLA
jgi:hypothetical protein